MFTGHLKENVVIMETDTPSTRSSIFEIGDSECSSPLPNPEKDVDSSSVQEKNRLNKFISACNTTIKNFSWNNNVVVKVLKKHCILANILLIGIITTFIIILATQSKQELTNGKITLENDQKFTQTLPTATYLLNFEGRTSSPRPYNGGLNNKIRPEIVVKSQFELRYVTQITHTILVTNLVSPAIPGTAGLSINCCSSVRHLNLQGPITQEWLHYLLVSLKNLERLTVNVDLVASGWNHGNVERTSRRRSGSLAQLKSLEKVELNSLIEIDVTNSRKNAILHWGFIVAMPSLKIVSISKTVFNEESFKELQSLLDASKQSIGGIEITESYICDHCDVTSLQFPNLEYMRIMRVEDTTEKFGSDVIPAEYRKGGESYEDSGE